MTGILSGMVVAFKQIKPEQEISLSSIGLRVKVGLDLKVQGIGIRSNKETCLFICSVLHLLKKCIEILYTGDKALQRCICYLPLENSTTAKTNQKNYVTYLCKPISG